jgi:hypothetical protein
LQMVELEAMLFGNKAAQLDNFSREHEQDLGFQAMGPSQIEVRIKTVQGYHPLLFPLLVSHAQNQACGTACLTKFHVHVRLGFNMICECITSNINSSFTHSPYCGTYVCPLSNVNGSLLDKVEMDLEWHWLHTGFERTICFPMTLSL